MVGQIGRLVEQVAPAGAGLTCRGPTAAASPRSRPRGDAWCTGCGLSTARSPTTASWHRPSGTFHPRGALAQGLLSLPVDDRLPQLARLLVDAIDPCVEASVEVTNDA